MSDERIEAVARAIWTAPITGQPKGCEIRLWPPSHPDALTETMNQAQAALSALDHITGEKREEPSDQWQPIETAPKDGGRDAPGGTRVLLYCGQSGGINVGFWMPSRPEDGEWSNWVTHYDQEELPEPTHWRPLPEPPRHASRFLKCPSRFVRLLRRNADRPLPVCCSVSISRPLAGWARGHPRATVVVSKVKAGG